MQLWDWVVSTVNLWSSCPANHCNCYWICVTTCGQVAASWMEADILHPCSGSTGGLPVWSCGGSGQQQIDLMPGGWQLSQ